MTPSQPVLGSLWSRLRQGVRWAWVSDDYRAALPADLPAQVMGLAATDRHHVKQGRNTARVRFDSPWGPLTVYLKRHERLPWASRLGALLYPSGKFTPAAAEASHLQTARALGVAVPDVVAAGEEIGPWGTLRSFLMVAELTGCDELHLAIPALSKRLEPEGFSRLKRELIFELAETVVKLHRASMFHKDMYLCHVFIDPALTAPPGRRLTVIDLHRLGRHPLAASRWRWKDLGQLLFSTFDVAGIDDRDRLRFWKHYRRMLPLRFPEAERRAIVTKANRYARHNAKATGGTP